MDATAFISVTSTLHIYYCYTFEAGARQNANILTLTYRLGREKGKAEDITDMQSELISKTV